MAEILSRFYANAAGNACSLVAARHCSTPKYKSCALSRTYSISGTNCPCMRGKKVHRNFSRRTFRANLTEPATNPSISDNDDAAIIPKKGKAPVTDKGIQPPRGFTFGLQFMQAAKFAAGVGALVMGAEILNQLLQRVEAVPLLSQFELFLGTLVTGTFTAKYLGGGEGRARIESFFEDLVDRIKGTKGFEDQNDPEPSMLDVQLRALIDEYVQTEKMPKSRGESRISVLHNKQSLVMALKAFVMSRDIKARRINSVLRRDLASAEMEKVQIREFNTDVKVLQGEAASAAATIAELTTAKGSLQVDLDTARADISALTERMEGVLGELEFIQAERQELQDANKQLQGHFAAAAARNEELEVQILELTREVEQATAALESAEKLQAATVAEAERKEDDARWTVKQLQLSWEETLQAKMAKMEEENRRQVAAMEELEKKMQAVQEERQAQDQVLVQLEQSLKEAELRADMAALEVSAVAAPSTASETPEELEEKHQAVQLQPQGEASSVHTDASQSVDATEEEKGGPSMSLDQLKVYARQIREDYVDLAKSAKEQQQKVDDLVQALVEKGAERQWANKYIKSSLAYARRQKKP